MHRLWTILKNLKCQWTPITIDLQPNASESVFFNKMRPAGKCILIFSFKWKKSLQMAYYGQHVALTDSTPIAKYFRMNNAEPVPTTQGIVKHNEHMAKQSQQTWRYFTTRLHIVFIFAVRPFVVLFRTWINNVVNFGHRRLKSNTEVRSCYLKGILSF